MVEKLKPMEGGVMHTWQEIDGKWSAYYDTSTRTGEVASGYSAEANAMKGAIAVFNKGGKDFVQLALPF